MKVNLEVYKKLIEFKKVDSYFDGLDRQVENLFVVVLKQIKDNNLHHNFSNNTSVQVGVTKYNTTFYSDVDGGHLFFDINMLEKIIVLNFILYKNLDVKKSKVDIDEVSGYISLIKFQNEYGSVNNDADLYNFYRNLEVKSYEMNEFINSNLSNSILFRQITFLIAHELSHLVYDSKKIDPSHALVSSLFDDLITLANKNRKTIKSLKLNLDCFWDIHRLYLLSCNKESVFYEEVFADYYALGITQSLHSPFDERLDSAEEAILYYSIRNTFFFNTINYDASSWTLEKDRDREGYLRLIILVYIIYGYEYNESNFFKNLIDTECIENARVASFGDRHVINEILPMLRKSGLLEFEDFYSNIINENIFDVVLRKTIGVREYSFKWVKSLKQQNE